MGRLDSHWTPPEAREDFHPGGFHVGRCSPLRIAKGVHGLVARFCTHCGKSLVGPTATFCIYCGRRVEQPPSQVKTEEGSDVTSEPAQPTTGAAPSPEAATVGMAANAGPILSFPSPVTSIPQAQPPITAAAPPQLYGSLLRALGVGGALLLFTLLATYLIQGGVTASGSPADASSPWSALLQFVYNSHAALPATDTLFAAILGFPLDGSSLATSFALAYQSELLGLLAVFAPLLAAGSYWYALRHLEWQNVVPVWVSASTVAALVSTLLISVVGFEEFALSVFGLTSDAFHRNPFWAAALLVIFPGWLVVIIALACACAGIGVGFATASARWPQHSPSCRTTRPQYPPVLSVCLAVGAAQFAVFILLDHLVLGAGIEWRWFPLGAILVAIGASVRFAQSRLDQDTN
jgi:hypothetical protein